MATAGDFRVLIDAERIKERVGQLAESISRDYKGRDLHLVGVLKGAFQFTRDLSRALTVPHSVQLHLRCQLRHDDLFLGQRRASTRDVAVGTGKKRHNRR